MELSLSDAAARFYDYCVLSRAGGTARTYKYAVQLFVSLLDSEGIARDQPTSLLQPQNFISFPSMLLRQGYSKKSIGTYTCGIKYFYDWLVMNDFVNPPDYAKALVFQKTIRDAMKRRESKLVRHPKKGQADLMADMVRQLPYDTPIKERNIALIVFLRSSGCRNAEATTLTVADFDLVEKSVVVTGKGSKQRRAYYDTTTVKALKDYWKTRGWMAPGDPAFARHDRGVGRKHKRITTTTVRNVVGDVCAAAGIEKGKFTPHYFRHSFAITMLRETGNLALVQDLLGHSSPISTRVYAKIYPDELRDAHHKVYE